MFRTVRTTAEGAHRTRAKLCNGSSPAGATASRPAMTLSSGQELLTRPWESPSGGAGPATEGHCATETCAMETCATGATARWGVRPIAGRGNSH